MYTFYKLIVYIHVLSAVASIGPFFVLLPLLKKIKAAAGEEMPAYIQVFRSSIRLVKHAGHLLVGSGVVLIWLGSWPWSTSWIVMTLVVMFSSIFFLARAFTPTLKKFDTPSHDRRMLVAALHRAVWTYLDFFPHSN